MTIQVVKIEEINDVLGKLAEQVQREKDFPDVMNLTQICKYLDITPPTVRERIKQGLPVSYKLGKSSPRFLKREIDAWLAGAL